MAWTRSGALLLAGLMLAACGTAPISVRPSPSPTQSATPTQSPQPTPTAQPSPVPSPTPTPSPTPVSPAVATMKCSGGPGTAMVVLNRAFVYDVADPVRPRLI